MSSGRTKEAKAQAEEIVFYNKEAKATQEIKGVHGSRTTGGVIGQQGCKLTLNDINYMIHKLIAF